MSFGTIASVEERLVLGSLSAPADPPQLPSRLDPTRLVTLADRHRVSGLVERTIRLSIDEPPWVAQVEDELASRREAGVRSFLNQMCSLVVAERTLEAVGAEHVVLKGPALARLYTNENDRHCGDLDLLLRGSDVVGPVVDAFIADGWLVEGGWEEWGSHSRSAYLLDNKDLTLRRPGNFSTLELHWRLFRIEGHLPLIDPFKEPVHRQAGGYTFRSLGAAVEMAYLLRHGTEHGWMRLKWLADIVRICDVSDAQTIETGWSLAFPEGHADASALAERLLLDARSSQVHGSRFSASMSRRHLRQRALVGTLLDLPPPERLFGRPFRSNLRVRAANLALAISLRPHGRRRLLGLAGALIHSGSFRLRRRLRALRRR